MSHKRITIRLNESEYQTIQARAAAVQTSVAEVVRALAVSGGESGGAGEQITAAISEVFAGLAARLDSLEGTGGASPAALDVSHIEHQIEQLAAGQARTERALSSVLDALEKLQTAGGFQTPSAAQPARQAPPSFFAWRDQNGKPEPGETPPQFTARMKQKYRETFGVDA